MGCNAKVCIAVHCCLYNTIRICTIRYKQRAQTTGRDKKVESSKGLLHDNEELGLLDEETGQQRPQSELEETHDTILLDDVGGASCDSEGEDETAPLLDKTAKKQSKDENSREREKETKDKGERTDTAREERVNDGKKEGERIPIRDTDDPKKRNKEVATKRNEGVPRDTDKPEQDTEKIAKKREAKDIDSESIAKDKEKGGSERGEAKDGKEIYLAEEEVKGEKVQDSKQGEYDKAVAKDEEEGIREGLREDNPLVVRDTKETMKERKRGGPRDNNQPETEDEGERIKERGKGDNEKAQAKVREKVKDTGLTEAEVLEEIGTEEIVMERKRGGPRNPDKGEARKEGEKATKKKKKEHRDKNTSKIEDRGAEAKDGEDKVKEKNKGDKDNKRRSREKDNP